LESFDTHINSCAATSSGLCTQAELYCKSSLERLEARADETYRLRVGMMWA